MTVDAYAAPTGLGELFWRTVSTKIPLLRSWPSSRDANAEGNCARGSNAVVLQSSRKPATDGAAQENHDEAADGLRGAGEIESRHRGENVIGIAQGCCRIPGNRRSQIWRVACPTRCGHWAA